MEDECLHGLEASWCSICIHGIERPSIEEAVITRTAKFDGFCPVCRSSIYKDSDTIILTTKNRWIHKDCLD